VTSPLLETGQLRVSYGAAQALFGVDVRIAEGEVVAVLGPNGAGKSTLAGALSGLVRPVSGTVRFAGEDVTDWPAHRIGRLGLAHIPEGRGIFPNLSVAENLRMRLRRVGRPRERAEAVERAYESFPVLGGRRRQLAGTLSGGEQQMLALAPVLAAPPRLLIADELSLGLAPRVVQSIFSSLTRAREQGVTIVLVEQFVHRALAFADRAVILRRGRVIWEGPAGDAGPEVLARYLSETAASEAS
jgi:branched-chain amino acid transport system ATP-binding protein